MSQILEVYLTLCHNAPGEHAEPLHCILSSRVSLAAQHAYLLSAAQQGKTFAEIAAEHDSSPEQSSEDVDDATGLAADYAEGIEYVHRDDSNRTTREHEHERHEQYMHDHPDQDPTEEPQYQEEQEEIKTNLDGEDGNNAESAPEGGLNANNDNADPVDHGENETSATSTVQGDEPQNQGSYDPPFDTCHAPGPCLCLWCDANQSTDLEGTTHGYDESSKHDRTASSNIDPSGDYLSTHNAVADASDDKGGTSNAHEDTESSHTVEAGDETYDQTLHADEEAEDYNEHPEDSHHDAINNLGDDAEGHDDLTRSEAPATIEPVTEVQENDFLDFEEGNSHELTGPGEVNVQTGEALEDEAYPQHEDLFDESTSNGIPQPDDEDVVVGLDTDTKTSILGGTPPTTPSGQSSKRKAMDDDDALDLLDYDTPDAKRRRPS